MKFFVHQHVLRKYGQSYIEVLKPLTNILFSLLGLVWYEDDGCKPLHQNLYNKFLNLLGGKIYLLFI